jgi:hypothetical protein
MDPAKGDLLFDISAGCDGAMDDYRIKKSGDSLLITTRHKDDEKPGEASWDTVLTVQLAAGAQVKPAK